MSKTETTVLRVTRLLVYALFAVRPVIPDKAVLVFRLVKPLYGLVLSVVSVIMTHRRAMTVRSFRTVTGKLW